MTNELDDLPECIVPLLKELDKYPEDIRDDMKGALILSCKTVWRERLKTWMNQHPTVRSRADIPPIVESGGKIYWLTRHERRSR